MTIINQYADLAEAYIDKGFLVNHGIPAEVQSDALAGIYPGIGGLGSISLVVPDHYAEQAVKLMDSRPAK